MSRLDDLEEGGMVSLVSMGDPEVMHCVDVVTNALPEINAENAPKVLAGMILAASLLGDFIHVNDADMQNLLKTAKTFIVAKKQEKQS